MFCLSQDTSELGDAGCVQIRPKQGFLVLMDTNLIRLAGIHGQSETFETKATLTLEQQVPVRGTCRFLVRDATAAIQPEWSH